MLYVAVMGALFLAGYRAMGNSALQQQLYFPVLLGLFLFSAFRFEVGCDWWGYLHQYRIFSSTTGGETLDVQDPLWIGIIGLLNGFDLPYPWLNVISSALFFAGMHALAKRQPDPLSFLILLFPILIINMPMSGIRQAAAIGIMGFAFVAFLDRRLAAFLFWTVVASLVHTSAIVFLLLAPLVGGQYTTRRLAAAGILAIPGVFVLLLGSGAELAIERYVGSGIDAVGALFRLSLLLVTGIFFVLLAARHWARLYPRDYRLVSIGSLMMLTIFPLVFVSTVIADRYGYYLVPIQTIILARLPYLFPGQKNRLLQAAPYLALALTFVVWTFMSSHFNSCYLPYRTWIFGFPSDSFYFL